MNTVYHSDSEESLRYPSYSSEQSRGDVTVWMVKDRMAT
jgi:hypothetical protein